MNFTEAATVILEIIIVTILALCLLGLYRSSKQARLRRKHAQRIWTCYGERITNLLTDLDRQLDLLHESEDEATKTRQALAVIKQLSFLDGTCDVFRQTLEAVVVPAYKQRLQEAEKVIEQRAADLLDLHNLSAPLKEQIASLKELVKSIPFQAGCTVVSASLRLEFVEEQLTTRGLMPGDA